MDHWVVTWNGVPFRKFGTNRREAEAFAERWQGKRYHSGMMKHGDKADYFEVKLDKAAMAEYADRLDTMKRGNPQRVIFQKRVED